MTPKKVGLFFGSFNPLTNAHVALANGALEHMGLDEVWFVLSPANPAKVHKNVLADENHRREMMRSFLAHNDDSRLVLCDIEFDMPRPSYTHNTLKAIEEKYPDLETFILCGTDTLEKILSWRSGKDILAENFFICQVRDKTKKYEWSDEVKAKTRFFDIPVPVLSSTDVRGHIANGRSYQELVPEAVWAYIQEHKLYGA